MGVSATIAARATPPGAGGVAVIRVSGPEAFAIARALTGKAPTVGAIQFARFHDRAGHLLDEGLVLAFAGPHSYTGEDVVEFQGHGGEVAPRRILEACFTAGARSADRGEFTRRAFLNGKLTYEQAEGVLALIEAQTERAADDALAGLRGRHHELLTTLYHRALDLSARVAYVLDVEEGELPSSLPSELAAGAAALADEIAAEVRRLREGVLLRRGIRVVLAGAPNAGKSSLLNALLKMNRAIVSAIPGTTRDTIEESCSIGGWPVRLIDTAGLRSTDDTIEAEGVKRTSQALEDADFVIDFDSSIAATDPRRIAVHAKCDLSRGEGLNFSSKTGEGLDALRDELARRIAARAEQNVEAPSGQEEEMAALLGAIAAFRRGAEMSTEGELTLLAYNLRTGCECLGRPLGVTYTADMLDRLFNRFCVGK